MGIRDIAAGGYRYIEGVFQYSGGVQALAGHEIVRVRFRKGPVLADGFKRIEQYLSEAGRPLAAFCACELRSPKPFSEGGFRSFNESYVGVLGRWGIIQQGHSPLARSNVCPEISPPAEPMFHAFCYTRPAVAPAAPSFVISGSGETVEGAGTYRERTVRLGDTSPAGMTAKARHVLGEMERRMTAFGLGWPDTTDTQVYTVFDVFPYLADDLVRRGAARRGFTWHYDRPPIEGLDFEVDCRGIATELVV
jgi:hypothetical protein